MAGDALWIARSDIKKLGLRAPADNHEWIEPSAQPGVQVSVDTTNSFRLALIICGCVTAIGALAYIFLVRQPISDPGNR